VEIESATQIGGGRKRADYLFRTDKREQFICEAKKPAEELHARYAFQAKRYAWNKSVPVAVLTDFEEFKIFIVGGKPYLDEPQVGEWKSWHYRQYPIIARELWDLLARDKIAAGSIDKALDALPKKTTGAGKARQQWLIKPDRNRALDNDFLEFLDETRRDLASDIYRNNDHDELLEGNKLTESVQRIIDRICFFAFAKTVTLTRARRYKALSKLGANEPAMMTPDAARTSSRSNCVKNRPQITVATASVRQKNLFGAQSSGTFARSTVARRRTFHFSMATSSNRISRKRLSSAMNGWRDSSVN